MTPRPMKASPPERSLAYRSLVAWRWFWPFPWTLFGITVGLLASIGSKSKIRWYRGTIVCYGTGLHRLLRHVPIPGGASAMTLGHTILARSEQEMVATHPHEAVHVRQYERWGLLFVPLYLGQSLWLWWTDRDPYRDNTFEQEAYQEDSTRMRFRT